MIDRRNVKAKAASDAIFVASVAAFLLAKLFMLAPSVSDMDRWSITFYALDYSYGFISKGLIGSFFRLIFSDRLTLGHIYASTIVLWLVVITLLAVLLIRLLRRIESAAVKAAFQAVVVLYVVYPYGLPAFMEQINFSRQDNFQVLLAVAAVACVAAGRRAGLFAVPLLCLAGVATHPIFVMCFMPVIGTVLLERALCKNEKSRAAAATLVVTCTGVLAAELYFAFWEPTDFARRPEELVQLLLERTSLGEIMVEPILHEYLIEPQDWIGSYLPALKEVFKDGAFSLIFIAAPFIGLFYFIWVRALRRAETAGEKTVFLLCIAAPLVCSLLLFSIDWYRWLPIIALGQLLLLAHMLCVKNESVCEALNALFAVLERRRTAAVAVIAAAALTAVSILKYSFYDSYIFVTQEIVKFLQEYLLTYNGG